jgi:hypothetical protein
MLEYCVLILLLCCTQVGMVFKHSQQDKGELTLTEYEVYLHQTHILTEVKVEKDLTWISKIE